MYSKIITELKYWIQVLFIPIYWMSHLHPRNKKIWLFGSTFGKRFSDNPKYFYLYINHFQKNDIKAVWISKSKNIVELLTGHGYNAYYYYSIAGIWYCLRAGVYLYDNYSKDISFWLSGGATKINLWHGLPLKKINMDNKYDVVRYPKGRLGKIRWFLRRMSDEKPSHYVLTTSNYYKNIFSSAFRTDKVLVSGYPRNDYITQRMVISIKNEIEELEINQIKECKSKIKNYQGMILYMPTFRNTEVNFFSIIDLIEFNSFLKKEGLLLCVKLHPKSKLISEFKNIESNNILVLNPNSDPYIFIEYSDILLTDYSSIYFDYLLCNKPIVFFNYDINEYLASAREMYFDYNEFTPGEKVSNLNDLKDALRRAIVKKDIYAYERTKLRNIVFDNPNQLSSHKLYNDICKIIE